MSSQIININNPLVKIVLSVALCVFSIYLFETLEYFKYNSIYFIISSFGIITIILNLDKIKYKIAISLVLSLNLCFFVFFSSMIIGGGIFYFFEKVILFFGSNIKEYNNTLFNSNNVITISIVAPLLIFFSYPFLLKVKKSRFFYVVIFSSIIILTLLGFTKVLFGNNIKMFIIWQSITMLALQLIIHQKEVIEFINGKKY